MITQSTDWKTDRPIHPVALILSGNYTLIVMGEDAWTENIRNGELAPVGAGTVAKIRRYRCVYEIENYLRASRYATPKGQELWKAKKKPPSRRTLKTVAQNH